MGSRFVPQPLPALTDSFAMADTSLELLAIFSAQAMAASSSLSTGKTLLTRPRRDSGRWWGGRMAPCNARLGLHSYLPPLLLLLKSDPQLGPSPSPETSLPPWSASVSLQHLVPCEKEKGPETDTRVPTLSLLRPGWTSLGRCPLLTWDGPQQNFRLSKLCLLPSVDDVTHHGQLTPTTQLGQGRRRVVKGCWGQAGGCGHG